METNLAIARRLYAAALAGDLATLTALLHPDVVLHDPGTHPRGGAHRGRDAVLGYLDTPAAAGVTTDVLDVMGGRDHASVLVHVRGERDGARLDNTTVHLLRISGGRVVEIRFHNRDQAHVDAYWSAVLPARAA